MSVKKPGELFLDYFKTLQKSSPKRVKAMNEDVHDFQHVNSVSDILISICCISINVLPVILNVCTKFSSIKSHFR